jgi:hypothetical protein
MTRDDCKKLIKYYRIDHSVVSDHEWCRALEFAVAGWDGCERNDYRAPLPPLTGPAPDDEPEAA